MWKKKLLDLAENPSRLVEHDHVRSGHDENQTRLLHGLQGMGFCSVAAINHDPRKNTHRGFEKLSEPIQIDVLGKRRLPGRTDEAEALR